MLELLCTISFSNSVLLLYISLSSDSAMTILVYFMDLWSGGVEFCSGVESNFVQSDKLH